MLSTIENDSSHGKSDLESVNQALDAENQYQMLSPFGEKHFIFSNKSKDKKVNEISLNAEEINPFLKEMKSPEQLKDLKVENIQARRFNSNMFGSA